MFNYCAISPRCDGASNAPYTVSYPYRKSFTINVKALVFVVVLASALAAPAVSFAQADGPVIRARVRAEFVQLEKAGYHMGDGDQTTYPAQI
jgi:hypothetical protein